MRPLSKLQAPAAAMPHVALPTTLVREAELGALHVTRATRRFRFEIVPEQIQTSCLRNPVIRNVERARGKPSHAVKNLASVDQLRREDKQTRGEPIAPRGPAIGASNASSKDRARGLAPQRT